MQRLIVREDIKRLSPAIKRMALKASTLKLEKKSYEYIHYNIKEYTKELLTNSSEVTLVDRRKTIKVSDVYYAAETLNYPKPMYDLNVVKKCTISPHKRQIAKIKFYQKQVDCTYFQKAVFERILKYVWENTKPLLMTKESKLALQLLVETRLMTLLQASSLAIIHRKGKKLQNKNMKLVEELSKFQL